MKFIQIATLINLISSVITIYSIIQGNSADVDIQIHNNFEEVEIEVEKEGNKLDIYIEKTKLPVEPNNQEDDKWLSGGDRT